MAAGIDDAHPEQNPFTEIDADRREIWDMLMRRDFEAFVAADWSLTANDFWPEVFFGIDAHLDSNPDHWTARFPTLDSYRELWLGQAQAFRNIQLIDDSKLGFLYRITDLSQIEICGNRALAHKKFSGSTRTADGDKITHHYQGLFQLARHGSEWKIIGFVGCLPLHAAARADQAA